MLSSEQNCLIESKGYTQLFAINKAAVVVVPTGSIRNKPKAILLNFNADQTEITSERNVNVCETSRQVFFTDSHYDEYIAQCEMLNSYHALAI